MKAWAPLDAIGVQEARALDGRRRNELAGDGPEVFETRRLAVPTSAAPLEAMVYRPTREVAEGILVWLHGGGWVAGSADNFDDQARALAIASGCVVLSVDYRLAPEHRFPSATVDVLAAVTFASAHADELGAEPGHLAIGGDSAGGNLAAATTLLARDQGGPSIDFQLLLYPPTCRDLDVPSRQRYGEGWVSAQAMTWYWAHYLERDEDAASPYASPLLAESMAGLPPAYIALAECDVLHDEGERYAQRLVEEGVPTHLRCYPGMLHGFMACAGVVDAAWDALREAGEAVRAALATRHEQTPRLEKDAEPQLSAKLD